MRAFSESPRLAAAAVLGVIVVGDKVSSAFSDIFNGGGGQGGGGGN